MKEKSCERNINTICVERIMKDGQNYRSLSGAAFAITGTQWNGKKFFGVK